MPTLEPEVGEGETREVSGSHFMAVLAEGFRRGPVEPDTPVRDWYTAPKVSGALAHLGERRTCNAEAVGAEPTCSTKFEELWRHS